MLNGADSAGQPTGAALKGAGVEVFCCYIGGAWAVTPRYLADLWRHDIWTLGLWEIMADAAARGAPGGSADARAALTDAKTLAMPKWSGIVLADDTSAVPYTTVESYWRAGKLILNAGGHLCGGYGPHAYCTRALAAGAIDFAMVAGGWEDGLPQTGMALKQHVATEIIGGIACDRDDVLIPEHAGLWKGNALYPGTEVPMTFDPVTVTCDTAMPDGHYEGTRLIGHPVSKVIVGSVQGGEGPNALVANVLPATGTTAHLTVKGASKGQVVTVNLFVLAG